jgi:hypothetical protein
MNLFKTIRDGVRGERGESHSPDAGPAIGKHLRQDEPIPGYDTLEPSAMADALSDADVDTLKAVREYERKLQRRPAALTEIARALQARREPGPAPAYEQPLVVGNGLPIKVEPERVLDS